MNRITPLTRRGQSRRAKKLGACYGQSRSMLMGFRYGRLIVQSIAERRNNLIYWLCVCDCGEQIVALQSDLKHSRVTTCGRPMCVYKFMKGQMTQ